MWRMLLYRMLNCSYVHRPFFRPIMRLEFKHASTRGRIFELSAITGLIWNPIRRVIWISPRSYTDNLLQVRRYSDFPPSYETLSLQPPSYDSVVIIEEDTGTPSRDRRRSSTVRTYVYDPMRRVSIEVSHTEISEPIFFATPRIVRNHLRKSGEIDLRYEFPYAKTTNLSNNWRGAPGGTDPRYLTSFETIRVACC